MRIFIDSSCSLAACGRPQGASRAVFDAAVINDWTLITSLYSISEVARNLPKLPAGASAEWMSIKNSLVLVRDVWTIDRPTVFDAAKDRPVLFTATAWADVLLTLDAGDFSSLLGRRFYALHILTPGVFLEWRRTLGELSLS